MGAYILIVEDDSEINEMLAALLLENGYDGFFSCEWVRRWNPLLSPPWVVLPEFVKTMQAIAKEEL